MTSRLPRRSAAARRAATPLTLASALALVAGLLPAPSSAARPAHRPAKRPVRNIASPLTPTLSGRAAPIQTLLVRDGLPAVGTNNAVRLWVRGDRSGGSLRVRLLAPSRAASPAADPLPRDEWISTPVPITFTGWHEVVLPQSGFSKRSAPPLPTTMDMGLPADAQPPAGMDDASAGGVDWSQANALALDVTTNRQATLIVDDIAWVTLDAAGVGTATTKVLDFEQGNVGAWRPVGTSEATGAVQYGVVTQPGLVHGGRVAFRLTVTPPGLARGVALYEAQGAMAASHKHYLIWTPASTLTRVLPESLPPRGGAGQGVNITACPEQTASATFCLYSPAALQNVAVSVPQDLQAVGQGVVHALPRADMEVRVVKVTPQSGSGSLRDPDTAGLSPGLLVKDDRVALAGTDARVRLVGPAVCDIAADTSKQFWLTVSVPRGTPAGSYVGRLAVSGRGLDAPFSVPVTLTVLPLRLLSPAKQYGVDLRSRLDPAPTIAVPSPDGRDLVTDFVPKETLDGQLADIAGHGFTIASLYDAPATLFDAVTEYRAYGLGTPYNLYKGAGDPQDVEKGRQAHSAPALTYYTDPEPNSAAASRMAPMVKAGLPNVTYIPRQADFDALNADADTLIYSRDSEYAQTLLRTGGKRTSMTRDWWYWPATNADPKTNRVDAGFLLWRSNFYGAFLPDYQTAFGSDPYDESAAGAPASKAAYRPLMLTYPVHGGVLDTLQWEACREGVTDVRYLTTMYAALRECKDAHIAKPLVSAAEGYVKTFLNKPLANLPDDQYDKARLQVAAYAIALRQSVDAYNKAHGLP